MHPIAIESPVMSMSFHNWFGPEFNLGRHVHLKLDAREKVFGPYRADIPCKDRDSDARILIENRLKRTEDHPCSGQL